MSIQKLMNQPLTVQPVGDTGTDRYGNPVATPSGDPLPEFGYLDQTETIEYLNDRQTSVSKWMAFLFANSAVTPLAYLNFGGQKFQVDGEPHHVYNPRTKAVDHIECKLKVVT